MPTTTPVKKLSSLGDLLAEAAEKRAEIAKKEAELRPLKEEFKELEARILASMLDAGTEQYKTTDGSYSVRRSTVPQVTDWAKLDKFILKTKSLDLLHRRLTATAWIARVDSGILVPGVEAQTVTTLAWRGAK